MRRLLCLLSLVVASSLTALASGNIDAYLVNGSCPADYTYVETANVSWTTTNESPVVQVVLWGWRDDPNNLWSYYGALHNGLSGSVNEDWITFNTFYRFYLNAHNGGYLDSADVNCNI